MDILKASSRVSSGIAEHYLEWLVLVFCVILWEILSNEKMKINLQKSQEFFEYNDKIRWNETSIRIRIMYIKVASILSIDELYEATQVDEQYLFRTKQRFVK